MAVGRGAKVKDLVMDGMSPTPNSIVWNGRDNQGAVVRSGVYLYKITSGKERVTGTAAAGRPNAVSRMCVEMPMITLTPASGEGEAA